MFVLYLKQTLEMLKQNKFISAVSILGTAFAIVMIMAVVIIQYVNEANIAPETNRSRTLYLSKMRVQSIDTVNWSWSAGGISYGMYKEYLSDLKTPEQTALLLSSGTNHAVVNVEGAKKRFVVSKALVNSEYWSVLSFRFLAGKPFDRTDYDSGLKKAVIKRNLAEQLFGAGQAVGRIIEVDFTPYAVVGVVDEISPVFTYTDSSIFMPATSVEDPGENGAIQMLILARHANDFEAIKQEVREAERKYEAANPEFRINFWGPYDRRSQRFHSNSMEPLDESQAPRRTLFLLLILLVVPAVNLSGFSMSRIKKRSEEIGVRKAFGAKKYTILVQVLYENLITSLIGGAIGLVLSYFVVLWLRGWLLEIPDEGSVPVGAFLSPFIFIAVFVACLVLNLLSAGIPALRTTRMNIVESLNCKTI
jgi:putative ABC transport system permease protein